MSEITSSMTTTATRLGTCFSFLLGAFCASGLVALLLLLLGSGAESAAEAASSKFAGRTCGNIWTHTHIYIYIYIFVVKQLGNSEPVCGRWGKFLGCLWSLTSGNNFLGATECDESGGCLHVTPRWGSWCVRQFGFRVDIVTVRFGGDLPVPISRYFFWCHAMKIM